MKEKIRIHSVGLATSVPNYEFEHCAFTNKIRKFPTLMKNKGYHIIEYSNEGSISEADEKVIILTRKELDDLEGSEVSLARFTASYNSPSYKPFYQKVKEELKKRVQPGDIIIHHYGDYYRDLLGIFPEAIHIEAGIGYRGHGFGAFRVYESYAWMHFLLGEEGILFPNRYQFVGGNSIELDRWIPRHKKGNYLLFVGRVIEDKGLNVIREIAKRVDEKILIAGLGNYPKFTEKNVEFIGMVTGEEKVELYRHAKALLVPSEYVEPFGIVNIEALSVGTPLITSDFGSFPEIVEQGVNGYRCKTLGDFLEAIKHIDKLDREKIALDARQKYNDETLGRRYNEIFRQILDLKKEGWYTEKSHLEVFKK